METKMDSKSDGKQLEPNTGTLAANAELTETLFQQLFFSGMNDKNRENNIADSSNEDRLIEQLLSRENSYLDESATELELDEHMERFVNDCLTFQDRLGLEEHFRNYLRENLDRITIVEALQVVQRVIQPKIRHKLKKTLQLLLKSEKLKTLIMSLTTLKSEDDAEEVTEGMEDNLIKTEEQSEVEIGKSEVLSENDDFNDDGVTNRRQKGGDDNRRRSGRLHSHPPGYFQTKPLLKVYILSDKQYKETKRTDNKSTGNNTPKIPRVKQENVSRSKQKRRRDTSIVTVDSDTEYGKKISGSHAKPKRPRRRIILNVDSDNNDDNNNETLLEGTHKNQRDVDSCVMETTQSDAESHENRQQEPMISVDLLSDGDKEKEEEINQNIIQKTTEDEKPDYQSDMLTSLVELEPKDNIQV